MLRIGLLQRGRGTVPGSLKRGCYGREVSVGRGPPQKKIMNFCLWVMIWCTCDRYFRSEYASSEQAAFIHNQYVVLLWHLGLYSVTLFDNTLLNDIRWMIWSTAYYFMLSLLLYIFLIISSFVYCVLPRDAVHMLLQGVCPSVRHSHGGILSKWPNISSIF